MWKVCVMQSERFRNVEKIFPTQQRDVSVLVKDFSTCPAVKRIVVFGSSVTSACNPWSDLDVFVELTEEVRLKKPKLGTEIDLWTSFDVDERLMLEIAEKGVVVFER